MGGTEGHTGGSRRSLIGSGPERTSIRGGCRRVQTCRSSSTSSKSWAGCDAFDHSALSRELPSFPPGEKSRDFHETIVPGKCLFILGVSPRFSFLGERPQVSRASRTDDSFRVGGARRPPDGSTPPVPGLTDASPAETWTPCRRILETRYPK